MRLIRSHARTVLAMAVRLVTSLLLASGLVAAPLAGASGSGTAERRAVTELAATPAQGVSTPVPRNLDVSQLPGNEAENTIAVSPTNPRNVAAMTCPVGRKNLDGLFLGVSFDGGRTWKRRLFATGAQVGHTCDERLAWDRFGNLWMSHLTKKGDVFFQSIAVDQATGDVAVGWYDCRTARGQGGHGCTRPDSYTQFWATYSTDGGIRFAPDFRVSQGTSTAKDTHSFFDYGDYTQVAFQSRLFYPAWSDNSDSTGTNPDGRLHQVDLYTARVRIP